MPSTYPCDGAGKTAAQTLAYMTGPAGGIASKLYQQVVTAMGGPGRIESVMGQLSELNV